MVWRVVVTDVRGRQHALDVADVEQLRRTWRRMLADPDTQSWKWWRLREPLPEACPAGHRYWPGWVSWEVCRCGVPHLASDCRDGCGKTIDPPHGPGCGPVPAPPDREGLPAWPRPKA